MVVGWMLVNNRYSLKDIELHIVVRNSVWKKKNILFYTFIKNFYAYIATLMEFKLLFVSMELNTE